MDQAHAPRPAQAPLGLWDTVSLIVGIIIGVGIFKAPGEVFLNLGGPWAVLGAWTLGGILSLVGALCFAELASTYPRSGGEYVYLTRAYGSAVGFLFAWAQLAVIRTGAGIAALAYIVAEAASQLVDLSDAGLVATAVVVIAALSLVNVLGTIPGKHTQNWLTIAKVVGLAGLVLAGFFLARPAASGAPAAAPVAAGSFWMAMIFVMYTYDGWNEASYVAGEVHQWRRTVPLALVLGTGAVMAIYLLVNSAILVGLGFATAHTVPAPVTTMVSEALGPQGGNAMRLLIIISALGAISGTIFAGARLYAELGADHGLFAPLSRWSHRWQSPAGALWFQAAISIVTVVAVGLCGFGQRGFDVLVTVTAPVFWLFFLLTGLALFVLRIKEPDIERPFRVPGYPFTPLVFCGWCTYMLAGSVIYAKAQGLIGLGILAVGLPLYVLSRKLTPRWKPTFQPTRITLGEVPTQRVAG